MSLLAHAGPLPVEELLPVVLIVFALGLPAIRAKAKARVARVRNRGDSGHG